MRAALKARGLHNGYATVDGSDWNIESLDRRRGEGGQDDRHGRPSRPLCRNDGPGGANFADGLSQKTWGRQPAQVIVLHETDMAALFIADLAKALRKDGWKIITADEAYADPISKLAPDVPYANGTLVELAAWEKGLAQAALVRAQRHRTREPPLCRAGSLKECAAATVPKTGH